MNRLSLLALLLLSLLTTPLYAADRVMVGYFATFGDLTVEQIPWDRLTHVCHAFLRVDAEGELVTTPAMPNPALTADARKNDVKTLVSIGGGQTLQGLEVVTATDEQLRKFVEAVAKVVVDGRYDGVDLDWEFPRNAETRDQYTLLLTALRAKLDQLGAGKQRLLLTAAVSSSEFFGQWVDAERVTPLVDWLNVMAYDFSGEWAQHAAHHAPLFASSDDPGREWRSVTAAMRYWEKRDVPKEKLIVSIPLFGRMMPAAEPNDALDTDLAKYHRAINFNAVRELVGKGWTAEWDNESRAPWLRKPAPESKEPKQTGPLATISEEESEPSLLIAYDDRNSVHGKATWAREQGYRGVSFWALHQDRMPDGKHWLIDAANKAWPAKAR